MKDVIIKNSGIQSIIDENDGVKSVIVTPYQNQLIGDATKNFYMIYSELINLDEAYKTMDEDEFEFYSGTHDIIIPTTEIFKITFEKAFEKGMQVLIIPAAFLGMYHNNVPRVSFALKKAIEVYGDLFDKIYIELSSAPEYEKYIRCQFYD